MKIRTSPVTKIKDFERVPEDLITYFARNKNHAACSIFRCILTEY